MTNLFGNKFVNNYGTKDNGAWLAALIDLTPSDLRYGFARMVRHYNQTERERFEVWPPNGKEFRLYCEKRLEDFGLPHANKAFDEWYLHQIMGREFSHPIIALAANMMGEQGNADQHILFNKFKAVYSDLCERFMNGEGLNLLSKGG